MMERITFEAFQASPESLLYLVFGDPNAGEFGSYFIRHGRSRKYLLPAKIKQSVMTKNDVDFDSDDDSSYWAAFWEAMDLAQNHWQRSVGEIID